MSNSDEADDGGWQRAWDARIEGFRPVLGKPTDGVWHPLVPFSLGGSADVLEFRDFVPGHTYVTAELTGADVGQKPSSLGNYELMMCTRSELPAATGLISRLAMYTCEAVLEPGETMDIETALDDSTLRALLFTYPSDGPLPFRVGAEECGLLLCLGITKDELAFSRARGSQLLLERLRAAGIFPYTVPDRPSVVDAPKSRWRRFFGR